jgi:hypothetical protein
MIKKALLVLVLSASAVSLGCNGATQTASTSNPAASCPAYPNGNLVDGYCITPAAATYELTQQGAFANIFAGSVTLESSPPIPTGVAVQFGVDDIGSTPVTFVTTGSPMMTFNFTSESAPSAGVCLPNPVMVDTEIGVDGGVVQVRWTTVPLSCQ